jgi:hypothetical protein
MLEPWETNSQEYGKIISCGTSPNIIRVIKSRRMTWAGLISQMGEKKMHIKCLLGSLK